MRDEPSRPLTVIYQSLREQIERGLLARGSKLPSERQLSELFSTTRITLREALGQLEDQGLIYREERRGWFVSPQRLLYNPLVRSHFHAMVADQGRVPETEVLGAAMIPASVDICQRLELPALSRVFQIRRARRVDGRLVLYVEHYLNPAYFPGIERSRPGRQRTCRRQHTLPILHGDLEHQDRKVLPCEYLFLCGTRL